jgi:hypothetical protein
MLLLYCEEQMGEVSSLVHDKMEIQRAKNRDSELLQQATTILDPYTNGVSGSDEDKKATARKIHDQLEGLIGPPLDPSSTAFKAIQDAAANFDAPKAPVPDNTDSMKAIADKLAGANDALKNDLSLNMMEIQTLMSRRQTAVELTTNLMASFSETLKGITANIGK